MHLLRDLFFVFWFFWPAGEANIAAFFSAKVPVLEKVSYPMDLFIKIRGKRLLGSHKTIRGLISGMIVGVLVVWLEVFLYEQFALFRTLIPLNYKTINPFLLGSLAGFGALIGDAVKSFFKRQMNIPPGKSWFPFDQIDYILGGILFTWFYIKLSLYYYILLFIIWFLLHPITTFIGYLTKLKEAPL